MREEQARDGDDLHEPLLVTAVAPVVVAVDHGNLLPGQGVELTGLAALVVLDGQQVVSAAFAQVGGVVALGVEGIGGNDHPREIRVRRSGRGEVRAGDFVGLRADLARGESDTVAMTDGGQDEDPAAVRAPRATQALAVHRDRPPPQPYRLGAGGRPVGPALFTLGCAVGHHRLRPAGLCGQQGPKVVVTGRADLTGIEPPQDAVQGLLARHPVAAKERVVGQAEGGQFLRRRTSAPLRRRGDRVVAGRGHRADHQGQQRGEPAPHSASPSRIGNRLELGDQAADLVLGGTLAEGFQAGRMRHGDSDRR